MEKNNIYKEDDKEFEKLQTLLKNLPQVKTPDNFEYNLLTRINNKNFEIKSEKKKNLFLRIYAPSFALAATVAVVFFLFTDKGLDEDDPWNSQPKLRPEMEVSESVVPENLSEEEVLVQSNELASADENEKENISKTKRSTSADDIALKSETKPNFPFDDRTSVDLDEMIESPTSQSTNNGIANPQLAKKNNAPAESAFKGFFLSLQEAEARKESLRTHEDSLRQKDDSLSQKKDSLQTLK